jgi:preprotein translocase subunit SecA
MAGRGTDVLLSSGLDQRVLGGFVSLLEKTIMAAPDGRIVEVRANTSGEADRLTRSVARNPKLSARCVSGDRLVVHPRGTTPGLPATGTLEFGLGLHLVSTEFNDSPRVALQLQGRSGRRGAFGSTRSLLVRSDRWLAGLEYGRPARASAGRVCWEEPELERQLRRRREAALRDVSSARALLLEHGAVLDSHTDAYYRSRQETLVAGPDRLGRWAHDAAGSAASDLVGRHFPGLVAEDYARRFASLAMELYARYGVDAEPAQGAPLTGLGGALAELMERRLTERREGLGAAQFGELMRLLLLQAGDELWENHRADLRSMAIASRLDTHGPKTAIAEYIIAAADAWQGFRHEVSNRFLSRMLHFPIAKLTGSPEDALGQPLRLAVDPRLADLVS